MRYGNLLLDALSKPVSFRLYLLKFYAYDSFPEMYREFSRGVMTLRGFRGINACRKKWDKHRKKRYEIKITVNKQKVKVRI
jgi:hypothetical protein